MSTASIDQRRPVRVGWLATSPVYYHSPLYRILAADPRLDFTAIFATDAGIRPPDASYPYQFESAEEALAGYRSHLLNRAATNPMPTSTLSLIDIDIVPHLLRQRYEVLVCFGYNSVTHAMAILTQRLAGRPVVLREEQTMLHARPVGRTVVKEVALRALFAGQRAAYVSSENRRWFEHYGIRSDRLFEAPYTVDNARWQSAAAALQNSKAELRGSFGIPPDAGPVILSVSKLIAKKQPLFLLDAFARVRRQHRCCLLVVGSGELDGAMRAKIAADSIPDVILTGAIEQERISQAYGAADVFALLSLLNETFGVVVAEAMNFGLPIVVSDKVGCHADLVRPGQNGFVVSAESAGDAGAALGKLVSDEALRRRFSVASRQIIERWAPVQTADGILAAVVDAVGAARWRAAGSRPDLSGGR